MLSELHLRKTYRRQPPPPPSTSRSIKLFVLSLHYKLSTGLIAGWLAAENQMKFVHFVCFTNYHANSSNSMKKLVCTRNMQYICVLITFNVYARNTIVNFLKILQIFYYRSFWHYIYRACIIIILVAVFDYTLPRSQCIAHFGLKCRYHQHPDR